MNAPAPIDPDLLRTKLIQAVEPLSPSPDALRQIRTGIRRRRLRLSFGAGAGALLVAGGAAAAVIALGSAGVPHASPVTLQPGQTGATPATTPAVTTTPAVATTKPPAPLTTGVPAAVTAPAAGTGSPVVTGPAVVTTGASHVAAAPRDVDGDGRPDQATTRFVDAHTAKVVVTLAAGRTVSSAAFPLSKFKSSGVITFTDVNADGADEVLVKEVGATATAYYLFQYLKGAVVEVGPPTVAESQPFLVGGGGGGQSGFAFDCVQGSLVVAKVVPTSMTAYLAGTDKSYVLTVTTLKVANGRASVAGVTRTPKLTQSQGVSLFAAQPHGRCGASQ